MLARLKERLATSREAKEFGNIFHKYRHFTMVPEHIYKANLKLALLIREVPGAIVECGTWRGGMIAGLADILGSGREYFLFDSFEGLPPAQPIDGKAALAWQRDTSGPMYHDNCRASEDEAKTAMSMSCAQNFTITKGWFEETLQKAKTGPIALLRMDADWYDSTRDILHNLGQLVVPGGLILIDDYYVYEGCAKAVNEYAAEQCWAIREFGEAWGCYIQPRLIRSAEHAN